MLDGTNLRVDAAVICFYSLIDAFVVLKDLTLQGPERFHKKHLSFES